MHESCSPAPHLSPLVPKEEPLRCALMRSQREIPRHYRTSSLDRGQRNYYLENRPDVVNLASKDTLIPDSEPEVIERLWEHIREDLERGMSSNERRIPTRSSVDRQKRALESEQDNKSKSRSGAPSETLSRHPSTQIGDSPTDITSASSTKIRNASPYDKDFRQQILTPRGIVIVEERNISVWDHFQTIQPDQDRISFYKDKGSNTPTSG